MKSAIVDQSEPITLIGGGDVAPADLDLALSVAPTLVAADGGADRALALGHVPAAVIGDLDSLSAEGQRQLGSGRLFPISEQDSTDFDKSLRSISAPVIVGVGFGGARLDHQLAVLNTLVRRPEVACVLLNAQEVVFHAPPQIALPVPAGTTVSLFPLAQVTGRSTGLQWPIDALVFDPVTQIGTSNRSTGAVTLTVDQPGLLVMLPRDCFQLVMQAFHSVPRAPWPARAG